MTTTASQQFMKPPMTWPAVPGSQSCKIPIVTSVLSMVITSYLTAFNSPFGHFYFVHLPFGLIFSQYIFQQMMDQILDRCEGTIGIVGDVVMHSRDDKIHNWHFHKFMQVAYNYGLVFNLEKSVIKSNSISFFGCAYDTVAFTPMLQWSMKYMKYHYHSLSPSCMNFWVW